jgi:hypothetical protein
MNDVAFALLAWALLMAGNWFRDIHHWQKRDKLFVIVARILLFVALFLYDMLVRGD